LTFQSATKYLPRYFNTSQDSSEVTSDRPKLPPPQPFLRLPQADAPSALDLSPAASSSMTDVIVL
jgi:hypothetical protein